MKAEKELLMGSKSAPLRKPKERASSMTETGPFAPGSAPGRRRAAMRNAQRL